MAQTVRVVIWAGSMMLRKEVQTGTENYTGEKMDSLEAWEGKAVESVTNKKKFLLSGVALVPLSFVTRCKNMMWLAFRAFPMKTVSCSLRLFARQVSRSTVGAKSAMS